MTGIEQIDAVMVEHKTAGRSSPAGKIWHEFWSELSAMKPARTDKPPVPLILAASDESDAKKHARLRQQLEWADRLDLLDVALSKLAAIPHEKWNTGNLDRWHTDTDIRNKWQ